MDLEAPSVHDEIAQGLREHPAKKGLLFNALVTAVEIGGSIGLFQLARSLGANDVDSYLAGSIGPLVGGLTIWARARKFSGASAAILSFTLISALIGLIFLGSCVVAPKPVVFFLAQRYGTDGTHEGMSVFDKMWDAYGDFRKGMYVTSYLWAALFLLQATGTALIVYETSYGTAYDFDQTLPLVATAIGIVGSIAIGRYFMARGKGQAGIASATPTEAA